MKLFRTLFLLTLVVAGLSSCHKDEADNGISGTWEGKWGFDEETPAYYERWEMNKNGDLRAYDDDGDLYAEGHWEVDGIEFTATYTSVNDNEYSFYGLYHDQLKEIVGTWGATPSHTNGGNFEMYK